MSGPTRARWSRPDDRIAVALGAATVFLCSWVLVHHWFWSRGVLVDWPIYQTYGAAIVHSHVVPYRDFPVEYPPGAIPVFVLPAWLGGDYATTFEWVMFVCGLALVVVTALWLRPSAALYAALAPVLAGSLILSRFDLWPALLATAALAAFLHDRHAVGWALLAGAVSAKLWPGVLVPPALVWSHRRGHLRAVLAGAAVLVLVVGPFALVAPHGVYESLRGQADRPLQVESLGAALFTTFGHPHVVSSHGSQGVAGHDGVAAVFAVAQIVAVVALWIAFARGPATPDRLVRYSVAGVAAFVAFSKVLSPQYLLWLIPLVPLVRGRRGLAATGVLTLALVLTQLWFPRHYFAYAEDFHRAWIVLVRDFVLVALVGVLAFPMRLAARS
jgi:uncharacterized membrane protein